MKKLTLLLFLCASQAFALEDTPENRKIHAERYLVAVPPREMLATLAQNMAETLPETGREEFMQVMTKHLDIQAITTIIRDSMVKHFTADELQALADFYGSALGKSALKKMGVHMSEVMPDVQEEVLRAYDKATEDK